MNIRIGNGLLYFCWSRIVNLYYYFVNNVLFNLSELILVVLIVGKLLGIGGKV